MIALDPDETVPVELAAYGKLAAAKRPQFDTRFMTAREMRKYARLIDAAFIEKDEQKEEKLLIDAFALALVGWRNVRDRSGRAIGFDVKKLHDVLTYTELWELAHGVIKAVDLAEHEKKASGSSPPDAGGSSARNVSATGAATTAQPQPSPG